MACVLSRLCALPRKLRIKGHVLNRLSYRRFILGCSKVYQNSTTAVGQAFPANECALLEDDEPDFVDSRQLEICGSPIWTDARAAHAVLERHPEYRPHGDRPKLFRAVDFEMYAHPPPDCQPLNFSKENILRASVTDLAMSLRWYLNTMGRDDFLIASQHIANRLPDLTNRELLEFMKAFYPLPFNGNVPILWQAMDQELLKRLSCNKNANSHDFFMQAMDVIFWLEYLVTSTFAEKYFFSSWQSSLHYPSRIQLLLYAKFGFLRWRHQQLLFYLRHSLHFLDRIKEKCPFEVFLVAMESFSSLNFRKSLTLPKSLQGFLMRKASENINNMEILAVISQMLLTGAKADCVPALSNHLFIKVAEKKHTLSNLVMFNLTYTIANMGVSHIQLLNLVESCLKIETVNPGALCKLLYVLYSNFGYSVVNRIAAQFDHELKRRSLWMVSEKDLLQTFMILMDCDVNASDLWETTMQGNVLVPCERKDRYFYNFHLATDDCIEVNCPEYKGSRLNDIIREKIYLENYNLAWSNTPIVNRLKRILQEVTDNRTIATDILPGYNTPGLTDFVICKGKKDRLFKSTNIFDGQKPWHVKKIPSAASALDFKFVAVWIVPKEMPSYLIKLKSRTLQKLGYISVKVHMDVLSISDECVDRILMSKLLEKNVLENRWSARKARVTRALNPRQKRKLLNFLNTFAILNKEVRE